LLDRFGTDVKVIIQPVPGLVEHIEAADLDGPELRQLVEGYVRPMLDAGADTIVLGSTHYVFLKPVLAELAGPNVALVETVAAVAFIALGLVGNEVHATTTTPSRTTSLNLLIPPMTAASTKATSQVIQALNAMVARNPVTLTATVATLVNASGASVGVSVIELGGATPLVWSLNGTAAYTAASTYKLVALMMEAQNIATGRTAPNGLVCYQEA